jgi:hypothetical protein
MLRIASLGFQTEKRALLYRSALDSKTRKCLLTLLAALVVLLALFLHGSSFFRSVDHRRYRRFSPAKLEIYEWAP